jgi:acetoin utilization deacetylase AcuC-like enzyme
MSVRVYWSEASSLHDTGVGHPEHNGRMDAALEGVRRAGLEPVTIGRDANSEDADAWIARVHSPAYEDELRSAVSAGARLFHSLDNPLSRGTFTAARGAVGAALLAADDIWLRGEVSRAFVIARPPGHHAERTAAMGFCFFNTIACVAERLRVLPGIERVFIFDWDVHHGNGTQHLFEERNDVFYASTHRFPFYPGTGASTEIGSGDGKGFTLNVPFTGGAGDRDYLRAVETSIARAIEDYRPDAILVSAGFDAHRLDPLGGMMVSERAFGEMTRMIAELADRYCQGRFLSLLEGGYDREGLASSVAEHVAALA